ncbi:hypothetical protein WOLCODRAFT_135754 [Wolfiporia cocos MD-104 SS10]|uniref:Uncharacterized protein n=1 Tax=Wolfiporia cocos (strain MD-104) TaxID=742152 RepID=A0A2H3J6S6_WOLCO|nr:hypothetical protein WOLCODRAFT_135754 [Wolfiporia cocos MD-104 SS10]
MPDDMSETAPVCSESAPELGLQIPDSSRSSLSASADSSLSASTSTSLSTPSHRSILKPSASFSSVPTRTNITFAPLPVMEPRRRKSNVQLGVAARSRMLQQRRMLREQGIPPSFSAMHSPTDPPPPLPIWNQQPEKPHEPEPAPEPDPAEEALAAIGRFMRGAGRNLLRHLSHKDKKNRAPKVVVTDPPAADSVLADDVKDPIVDDGEGGVWEEEVGSDRWQRLGAQEVEDEATESNSQRINTVEPLETTPTILVNSP